MGSFRRSALYERLYAWWWLLIPILLLVCVLGVILFPRLGTEDGEVVEATLEPTSVSDTSASPASTPVLESSPESTATSEPTATPTPTSVPPQPTATPMPTPTMPPTPTVESGDTTSPAEAGSHIVARGDNLWRIAERYYESGFQWVDIYQVNQSIIADPDLIYPEQELILP